LINQFKIPHYGCREKLFKIEGIDDYIELLIVLEDQKRDGMPLRVIKTAIKLIKHMLSALAQINLDLKSLNTKRKTDPDSTTVEDILFEIQLVTFFGDDYNKEIEKAIIQLNNELLVFKNIKAKLQYELSD